jgi:hypothetical protein
MKLLRFGSRGREKPGLVDAQGRIRDLSKIVLDVAGDVLSPKGLAKLRKLKPDKLPLVRGSHGLAHASARSAISSPSASIIPITPPKPGCRSQRADRLQQGAELHLRTERRHHDPKGIDQARL